MPGLAFPARNYPQVFPRQADSSMRHQKLIGACQALIRTAKAGRAFRYAIVGGIGFCTDGGILYVLVHAFGWSPLTSRLISFPVAVVVTWLLNRTLVFKVERRPSIRELSLYVTVQIVGIGVNLGVYGALVLFTALERYPTIALAIAAVCAALFNYAGATKAVFRP